MDNYESNPLERYTVMFKSLSDMTRLKIMWLLFSVDSKICVSEIIDVLGENQYNVSKHLNILKNAGLIYKKKEGKWIFYHYQISNEIFNTAIRQAVLTIPKELMADEVSRCMKRLSMRVDDKCVVGTESDEWAGIKDKK